MPRSMLNDGQWSKLKAILFQSRWSSIYKKFNHWSMTGKWLRIFKAVVQASDLEWIFIDGSYIKAHQHSTGAPGKNYKAMGISRAGHTRKIHLAVV